MQEKLVKYYVKNNFLTLFFQKLLMSTSNKSPTLITTANGKHHVTVNSFLTMKKRKRFQPMTCIANANKKESNKEQFTFSIDSCSFMTSKKQNHEFTNS